MNGKETGAMQNKGEEDSHLLSGSMNVVKYCQN